MGLLMRPRWPCMQPRRSSVIFLLTFVLLGIGLTSLLLHPASAEARASFASAVANIKVPKLPIPGTDPTYLEEPDDGSGTIRTLHLLMHAPRQEVTLCKAITSSLALDYPTPRLINWDQEDLEQHNDNLAKFSAFEKYLESLPAEQDEDLVLIVDGYNAWFQLRPEMLIQRFFKINGRMTQLFHADPELKAQLDLKQKVLFAAQRSCGPWDSDDPACSIPPDSTLPADIYGEDTDKYNGDSRYPYATFRPRFLNSGAYMGQLGPIRALMTRAREIATTDRTAHDRLGNMWQSSDWSKREDQIIFQRIFEHQEFAREHGNCSESGSPFENCEFGIGLDYESRVAHAHALTEGGLEWMRHEWLGDANPESFEAPGSSLGSGDLLQAQKPFESLRYDEQPGWEDVMLFSDRYTSVVPAIVQHDMDAENLLRVGDEQWRKMWYREHVQDMLDLRAGSVLSPDKTMAKTMIDGEEVKWRISGYAGSQSKGAFINDDEFIEWSEICGAWEDDVFRGLNNPGE